MAQGFDLQSVICRKGWDGLFDMLYGYTYSNLVRELWVNASVQGLNLGCVILFEVSGVPITITSSTNAYAIKHDDEGFTQYMMFWEH